MKKISIIGLSVLLTACASDTYEKGVTSESYKEDYKVDTIAQPITAKSESMIKEESVMASESAATMKAAPVAQEKKPVQLAPQTAKKKIKIVPPTNEQMKKNPRYGYTIQVIALDRESKLNGFANKLPDGQPIWGNYKQVKGTNWYTILYGDYASRAEAKAAISTLPKEFQKLKPFAKSIDDIKNSDYPSMNKLK
ncbi:SPOR domain-containing protein [Vibrio tapetis]|uniref:SPOR domain-containing protein n=1 Tax=Vibrio tapetis subsp. tapetis TaxID=1671868 RepID=A0A2N8ZN09_9VIBR|nr:SPOR domain-containing protein [Vibrio tapetis]SON53295.1 conserved exported protein of unknown function [Vibrio tapetis subsp. tapetis]